MTLENPAVRWENADNICIFPGLRPADAEANHRIANSLALLSSTVGVRATTIARQGGVLDSGSVAQLLREICSRIANVGELHRALSAQPEGAAVDLNRHLRDLCRTLIAGLAPPDSWDLTWTSSDECEIDAERLRAICLIVTEVVINALKYAHPSGVAGRLTAGCHRRDDGSLEIGIADDGVGFPEDFDVDAKGGLGSRTVRSLAQQLGADAKFVSSPLGLRFTLLLPPA